MIHSAPPRIPRAWALDPVRIVSRRKAMVWPNAVNLEPKGRNWEPRFAMRSRSAQLPDVCGSGSVEEEGEQGTGEIYQRARQHERGGPPEQPGSFLHRQILPQ